MTNPWINLSQPIFNGIPMPKPHGEVSIWVDRFQPTPDGPLVRITHLETATHVGAHVDAPAHFIPDGRFIHDFPDDHFVGEGVVLDVRCDEPIAIDRATLERHVMEIRADDIVMLYTGWAERFRDHSYHDHPYLDGDAARWLVERGIRMVGLDTMTPDMPGPHRPPDFDWPVHHELLGNDVLIMENLGPGLARLLDRRVEVLAPPMPIEGADGAPIVPLARAISQ